MKFGLIYTLETFDLREKCQDKRLRTTGNKTIFFLEVNHVRKFFEKCNEQVQVFSFLYCQKLDDISSRQLIVKQEF